ncbi:hypothetical protein CHS0354_019258 [Potamilus streckersoni]|uniref:G-protein coupled receptors family 1 profile domain-containing protein n=1 Tax=Potamilus streckersoni TaxID=2493646 RepID=A0AAE0SMC5_9BIVA|nr:hypothetical protein CHS0354_019258 [Potamilus streckersoni]
MTDNSTTVKYDDISNYPEQKAGIMLWSVIPPILISFGTVGNILSIIVLTRRSIRSSTTALYLTVLAFSDLVVLYTGLLRQWLNFLWQEDVRNISELSCKIHLWFVYISLDFSAWILIAVTLERVISSWFPHSAKSLCSRKRAASLMIAIFIFLLILNGHLLFGFGDVVSTEEGQTTVKKCKVKNNAYKDFFSYVWPWIDLCIFCLIPFVILFTGNVCILIKVIQSAKRTRQVAPMGGMQHHRTSNKQSSLTAMLFTLNVVFLLCTSPISVYNIGYSQWEQGAATHDYAVLNLWWAICSLLMYVNNSLNFLLYCLSGSRFRQEVKNLFCWKRQANISPLKTCRSQISHIYAKEECHVQNVTKQ